ncbi:IS66 family transposase [Pontibacter pamirensis]|uniref:IS66 family transposase n=1 Tax=Pontibacter pamirensis TaxID=2562824 RepID=UPI00138946C2|nr:IS66 family transposase [Pontibacter pamirensis]
MQTALENLSKEEMLLALRRLGKEKDERIAYPEAQVQMYRRMQFGQKRERFEGDPNQTALPFQAAGQETKQQQQEAKQKVEYVRRRPNHKGRAKLPEHLPVEEVEIHPEGDLSQIVCIGKEVTEELECRPARFFIRRYIRYKYAPKDKAGVEIGVLPERVIDKGISIASFTIEGWAKEALVKLEPLYEQLVFDTKAKGYLQVDESPVKVLDSDKKGACHQGYYWVYHSPLDRTVLFDYQTTRAAAGVKAMLDSFRGYLQTDGYAVYEKYGRKKEITHLACWAHARREFERALDNDRARAEKALTLIQHLYATERKAREGGLEAAAVKELRLTESLPVLNELGSWIFEEIKGTLPKSQIGKAMAYAYARWDALSAYLYDGNLHIDNNGVENALRPLALGRNNYLFAGSHKAAKRADMAYSFFAICKKHGVNPYLWLKYNLENIMSINHKNLQDLYPQNFKNKSYM